MDEEKFRAMLSHFIHTEMASPALLELLEERLEAAIGHQIDAEIARHSLVGHHLSLTRPAVPSHCRQHNQMGNNFLAEFCSTDSECSSRTPSQSRAQSTHCPLVIKRKIHCISNDLAKHSEALRAFHAEVSEQCKQLVQELWHFGQQRDSRKGKMGSAGIFHLQKHLNGFNGLDTFSPQFLPSMHSVGDDGHRNEHDDAFDDNNSDEEGFGRHNDAVALSSFSLSHSMQEWPEEEMQNIVWLICSDGMEQNVRLTNIQKLLFVSPISFSKSKAFEIFLGHLHAILPLPLLFNDTMHVLARILSCPNETIWLKSANCLSRVAHGVMRSPSLSCNDKKSFGDFFRQILNHGPHIWRNFEQQNIGQIVQSFMEMLTNEISAGGGGGPSPEGFLAILAKVDPETQWLLPWLHRQSILKLMMPKFSELIKEILDHHGRDQPKYRPNGGDNDRPRHCAFFWAFEASILFRCLQHLPVFDFLREIVTDRAELQHSFCRAILHFLSLAFAPSTVGPKQKGFVMARRIVVQGLLETTTSDCGAAMLSSIELFLKPLFWLSFSAADGAPLLVQMAPSGAIPFHSQMFNLCFKVLLNELVFSPCPLSDNVSFLALVEQSIRQHMTLFMCHNDSPFANEITVQLLSALFEHFPVDKLRATFSDLVHTLLVANFANFDHSNQNHRRLIIATAFLTFMDNNTTYQWSQWRKSVGKKLNKVALRYYYPPKLTEGISPTNPHNKWATFATTIELCESEKHFTTNSLLQFLGLQQKYERVPQNLAWNYNKKQKMIQIDAKTGTKTRGSGCSLNSTTNSVASEHCEENPTPKNPFYFLHCLDFLPSAPTDFRPVNFHFEPLPGFVFFLITQPELLTDLFRSDQFGQLLLKQFAAFERVKDSKAQQQMIKFIGKMDFLITNLDMLTALRHFVPNLGAKLAELLRKYCSDSSGNLILCELSRMLCLFLSHSVVASPSERRFCAFDRIDQIRAALANIPKSLYRKEEETERQNDEEEVEEADIAGGDDQMKWQQKRMAADQSIELLVPIEEDRKKHLHQLSTVLPPPADEFSTISLEETDFPFWFAVLPEKDTDATRHELIRTLFKSHKQRLISHPFALMDKFATKFWRIPDQNRMTIRPPQHSEWLSVLADYAHGLELTDGTRANVRKRMGSLRLSQQNEGQFANDWFLAALFLSSGLSAEATSNFCERLLERFVSMSANCHSPSSASSHFALSVGCVWPMCCSAVSASSRRHSFPELVALRVFPRALSLIRRSPAFRPLRGFLSSCQLPSLFHLLLFYTNQAYVGILPFRAVQQYLVVAVLGGPHFQALHFCAVLAHIFQCSTRHHSIHFSSKLASLFLRPIFLADFHFSKYAFIETDEQ